MIALLVFILAMLVMLFTFLALGMSQPSKPAPLTAYDHIERAAAGRADVLAERRQS